jgi:hypothetical protein
MTCIQMFTMVDSKCSSPDIGVTQLNMGLSA